MTTIVIILHKINCFEIYSMAVFIYSSDSALNCIALNTILESVPVRTEFFNFLLMFHYYLKRCHDIYSYTYWHGFEFYMKSKYRNAAVPPICFDRNRRLLRSPF